MVWESTRRGSAFGSDTAHVLGAVKVCVWCLGFKRVSVVFCMAGLSGFPFRHACVASWFGGLRVSLMSFVVLVFLFSWLRSVFMVMRLMLSFGNLFSPLAGHLKKASTIRSSVAGGVRGVLCTCQRSEGCRVRGDWVGYCVGRCVHRLVQSDLKMDTSVFCGPLTCS